MIHFRHRRLAASSAVLALTTGLTLFAGGTAHAATTTVTYSCQTPILGTQTGDVQVTIDVPATANVGDTVTIDVTTSPSPVTPPITLDAGSVTAAGDLAVSGAQSGTATVTSRPNSQPLPAGQPAQLPPLTGTLTLTSPGQVNLTPGTVTATAVTIFGTFTIPCSPASAPGVGASIQVS
ncbi:hypothetical protein [Sphaerisporangium fuscum]|uniref:hypothetical protein n=1 Tax=Sphaerisporangium fuscum TaxID=2835868 RepID=UPI001BDD49C1|nr:hypothetical protein [Sphaerisporangium fuscum]